MRGDMGRLAAVGFFGAWLPTSVMIDVDTETGASMTTHNAFAVRPGWPSVGLALLPGLALIALKSGMLQGLGGPSVGNFYTVPILCLALVLASLLRKGRFEVWSYPALGIALAAGLSMFMGVISALAQSFRWSNPLIPIFITSATVWGALLILAARYHLGPVAPRAAWVLLAVLIGACVVGYGIDVFTLTGGIAANAPMILVAPSTLFLGLSLLPVLIAWHLARKDGTAAALVVLAAEYLFYDVIAEPGYALAMHTQEAAIVWLVNNLPAVGLLILAPLWVMTARSFRSQALAFLLPSSLVLAIVELLSGSVRPEYTPVMWLRRGLGASEYVLVIALAVLLYHAYQGRTDEKDDAPHLAQETT